ncbi:hypothetical protein Q9295_08280 [Xinfangfangia sp. CPCC 101601]|uniref:Signal recognition particle n=1 Tax=Pseudogemmobacter lacusdianii TaxID=3069608 RepID=A0ABU0VX79_9RHOB|nr:hypothetical protein [Xinfangfangia sp. CPCC 101601]MDQ2066367.1 hypothetical protein [Xinfangfangia sp. CPCC 101601]
MIFRHLVMVGGLVAALMGSAPTAVLASDHCVTLSQLAAKIMEGRQNGVTLIDMMQLLKSDDEFANELMQTMVLTAYDLPGFSTDSMKKQAVTDFANNVALMCYKAEG